MLHKLASAATAGVEKTRIRSSELKIGMYVALLDRPWIDSPFLVHGFTIRDERQLAQLKSTCKHVYVDITRGSASSDTNRGAKPAQTIQYEVSKSFAENLDDAIEVHKKAKHVVNDMFTAFRSGNMFNTDDVRETVSSCVDNIIVNPDSMLWLSMIKNKDEYTAEHSLNVALLSVALGVAEGLPAQDLQDLGVSAMLHDVGKVKIPNEILQKEGHLDQNEFEVMKMHTVHGKKLLLRQSGLPDAAVDIALSHHEKLDGTGYPRGLSADQIPYLVRIVAIADAYDAMTSGRVYCDAKSPAEALKLLLKSKDAHHDGDLLNKFIECVGVYPIGSIVELTTGESGIIIPSQSNSKLQPIVLVARGGDKQPCKERWVDLSKDKRPDNGRPYRIRALHSDGTFGLRLAEYQRAGSNLPQ